MGSSPHVNFLKMVNRLVVNNFFAVVAVTGAAAMLIRRDIVGQMPPVHALMVLLLMMILAAKMRRRREVYLVEYGCFGPKSCYRTPFATCLEHAHLMPYLVDEESVAFAMRLLERSGLGEETCVPDAYHYMPPDRSLRASREEAELVIFSAVDDVFAKTTTVIKPCDIDVLIVNCSIFTPTPVFADMVVNRYKLRDDVKSVNLSGMGCSAGLVSVGLAKNILHAAPLGTRVLVVSTEILSSQYYVGTERAMLLPNCLFRMTPTTGACSRRRTTRATRASVSPRTSPQPPATRSRTTSPRLGPSSCRPRNSSSWRSPCSRGSS